MINKLENLKNQAIDELSNYTDIKYIDEWHIRYLGRKGELTQFLRGLPSLSIEDRKKAGALANDIKTLLENEFEKKQKTLKEAQSRAVKPVDITLPGRSINMGRLHPTTQMIREISDAFSHLGFEVVEGPEVETDYYNFEALNIPKDHPARDMWDTLWVTGPQDPKPMLLRTHTSPMQIRVMEQRKPPVRVVIPGKTYRYEATDATHETMFYQIEGLAVDKGITMADLKGTLFELARRLFGNERKARFRCDYFPFVEPGVEMAIDCFICEGKGCRLCKNSGWIEIMGAGMVHPDVLRRVNYDPDIYTGFAFGGGVERMFMLKHDIDDIRLFYGNDLRFLKQF